MKTGSVSGALTTPVAARVYAASSNADCGANQQGVTQAVSANSPCLGSADGEAVVPVDLQSGTPSGNTASTFRYLTDAGADDVHHILEGHGGLAQLAAKGLTFSRYYATSGKCDPTRASIVTGRYPLQVGVDENHKPLEATQLTIAQYLKNMCNDGVGAADTTPCYTTGFIGKWGFSDGQDEAPWGRGFDFAFFYGGDHRPSWSTGTLRCAPPVPHQFYCTAPLSTGQVCTDDSDCSVDGSIVCSADGHCYSAHPSTESECTPGVTDCGEGFECKPWSTYLGPATGRLCHHDDVNNPLCCQSRSSRSGVRSDTYRFSKKVNGNRFWKVDNRTSRPCDNNAIPSFKTGCSYDTRYYRDVAKNFILRNAQHISTDNADRFFLYFAPHALHTRHDAPFRTQEHYATAELDIKLPANGQAGRKFWGALEEVDAAVGQILDLINGYCDTASDTDYGTPCTSSSQCTSSICNTTLKNNTLILFTADQGRPTEGYGEPGLRDGKGSMYEGGIRVGLLARGPGLGIVEGTVLEGPVASHVDLFATIAHAARCKPDDISTGRYTVNVCADITRKFCDPTDETDDCAQSAGGGGGACEERLIAGHTLLPELVPGIAGSIPPPPRPFAFAQYSADGKAVMARRNEFTPKVCGQRIPGEREVGLEANQHIERVRRIHSCTVCNNDASCEGVDKTCWSDGSFCVPSNDQYACSHGQGGQNGCIPQHYARYAATAPCPDQSYERMQLLVPCEKCMTDSAWKLRGGGGENESPITVTAMFDLATNPEEDGKSDCKVPLPGPGTPPANTDPTKLEYVEDQMGRRLDGWYDCVTGTDATKDCDTEIGDAPILAQQ